MRLELRTWGHPRFGDRARGNDDAHLGQGLCRRRLAAWANDENIALYEGDLDAMRQATRKLAAAALPVDSVVRCVVHALAARRPWTRYPVGLKVNLLLRAYKWIPDRIWDWMIQRSLGLPTIEPS